MKSLFLVLTLLATGMAQELPDNPKPQEVNPYSGHRVLGWKETFKAPDFYVPYLIVLPLATMADIHATRKGVVQGPCVEGNGILPLKPTLGQLYREAAIENGVVTAFAFFMKKAGFKWWVWEGPAVYGTVIHVKGTLSWTQTGCL